MRDRLKDSVYFNKVISNLYESIDRLTNWILIGKTPAERIDHVKRSIVQNYILISQCKYSNGSDLNNSKEDLKKCFQKCYESWDGFWKLEFENVKLDQYTLSGYEEMLWMLSLGYLLDIPNENFKKLVEVIDRDGVKDVLFEFIIRAKLKDRQPINEESYQEFFDVPQTFDKLRKAIRETDKTQAEKLIEKFIKKDWYKNHKGQGWYNSHKSNNDVYVGYWSFETAAVVKIMNLNDGGFIDCQYYPKDLI